MALAGSFGGVRNVLYWFYARSKTSFVVLIFFLVGYMISVFCSSLLLVVCRLVVIVGCYVVGWLFQPRGVLYWGERQLYQAQCGSVKVSVVQYSSIGSVYFHYNSVLV